LGQRSSDIEWRTYTGSAGLLGDPSSRGTVGPGRLGVWWLCIR
jgi:hypothetical protein